MNRKASEISNSDDDCESWIKNHVIYSPELEQEEKIVLQDYFQGVNTQDAKVILIVDSLIDQRLQKIEIRNLSQHPNRSPKDLWKSFFKRIQTNLTISSSFLVPEVDFLVDQIQKTYLRPFIAGDKRKTFGPFLNKTYWSELTYAFNQEFSNRMRGVVAIRNKVKGLMANPPTRHAENLMNLKIMKTTKPGFEIESNQYLDSLDMDIIELFTNEIDVSDLFDDVWL